VGKGRDFRRGRRGFDDDDFVPPPRHRSGGFGGPPSFDAAPREAPATGPVVVGTVKWFNGEKGFGFVALSDGSGDAFLHVAVLSRSGHNAVQPGASLKMRVGQGQKGPQVTEVVEVDESTAEAPRARPAMGMGGGGGSRAPVGAAVPMTGTVKWYNADKGFGFVAVPGGGKDVFVHATALQRSGLVNLAEGQRVTMDVAEGRKGPEAVAIRAAD
jgi:CspA family cold shock protein